MSSMRERFNKKGFGVNKYAKAHNINHCTLSMILDGVLNGEKSPETGRVRRALQQLKNDGVYIGRLPWEKSKKNDVNSGGEK